MWPISSHRQIAPVENPGEDRGINGEMSRCGLDQVCGLLGML